MTVYAQERCHRLLKIPVVLAAHDTLLYCVGKSLMYESKAN